jgi:serine/threonine protein kinase
MLNKLELKDDKIKNIILGNISDYFTIQKIINKKDNEFVAKVESKLDKNIFIMKKIYKNKISPIENLPFREEFFLKVLNHENIVKYYTSFEDSQYLYIITEYVNNGDLSQILSHKSQIFKIPEKKLLDIDNSDLKYNLELNDLLLLKKYLKSIGEITDLFFNLQVDYANTIKDEENYADLLISYREKLLKNNINFDITDVKEFINRINSI